MEVPHPPRIIRSSQRPAARGAVVVLALMTALSAWSAPDSFPVRILATNGVVEVLRAGAQTWDFATVVPDKNILRPGDQLRTGPNADAMLQLADRTQTRAGPNSQLMVMREPEQRSGLMLFLGRYFFFHRDEPGQVKIVTTTTTAAIDGTEFTVDVAPGTGATRIEVIDGAVSMTNAMGRLALASGEAGLANPGQAPVSTPAIGAVNAVQWSLYYPAILDPDELPLNDDTLAPSLQSYRTGDLREAHSRLPQRDAASPAEQVYQAALILALGHVDTASRQFRTLVDQGDPDSTVVRLAQAHWRLVAAVKGELLPESSPTLATEWLALSYYQQSQGQLFVARESARRAVGAAPGFAFAQVRLAELEFSFGRGRQAREAVQAALDTATHHAQAWSLDGFLLAAGNQFGQALEQFDRAIELDSGLANAWLGRGLCRIQQGDREAGRADLLTAAAVEPQRSILRSYLAKAYMDEGEDDRASHELDLARSMDPGDPTPWLYAALLDSRNNQVNRAIRNLETSRAMNDNRSVYRSRHLLDQDRAVRGANLANLYRDADMRQVGYREAARAVHDDYANFSSHLFLADSFNQLTDPRSTNLRFDIAAQSEYLIANLLAPVGAGTLSRTVSQEEYSRLFDRRGLGVVSVTDYTSNGDWNQFAAQHGRLKNLSYAVETTYRNQNGQRPNNDFERLDLSFQAKIQVDARNDLYVQTLYSDAESGDVSQRYSPDTADRTFRLEEHIEPAVIAGYHHEWSPAVHTLFLGTYLDESLSRETATYRHPFFRLDAGGDVIQVSNPARPLSQRIDQEIFSAEIQQIIGAGAHQVIVGSRMQVGEFTSEYELSTATLGLPPSLADSHDNDFDRVTVYGYYHWKPTDPLTLIGGLSYDHMRYPENHLVPPLQHDEETTERLSPKAGLIWMPLDHTTFRAAYTHSLTGVSRDQVFQLEPPQVAGFVQSYRTLMPASVVGVVPGQAVDALGVAWDQQFATRTYLGLTAEWLWSDAERDRGVVLFPPPIIGLPPVTVPSSTREDLDYEERSLQLVINQLLGDHWSVGASYRLSHADLESEFVEVPSDVTTFNGFQRRQHLEAVLHQVRFHGLWTMPTGVFAGADALYSLQSNHGYATEIPGDEFWQFNAFVGYRFPKRRAELSVGVLNLTDRDYRLNPLNLTAELPRDRTVAARFRFAF